MYEVQELSDAQVEKVFPLMKELRPHLDADQYLRLYKEAKLRDDYRLYGVVLGDLCVSLMGARVLYDFTHGKHLYIDDLVTTKDLRGQGLGRLLLQYALELARNEECTGLRLGTGVDNRDGQRFYEREGWSLRSLTYKIKI